MYYKKNIFFFRNSSNGKKFFFLKNNKNFTNNLNRKILSNDSLSLFNNIKKENSIEKIEKKQKEEEIEEEYINPITGERGGPKGPEPTRNGDWEFKGRCTDF